MGVGLHLVVVQICVSQVISEVEHLFLCLYVFFGLLHIDSAQNEAWCIEKSQEIFFKCMNC